MKGHLAARGTLSEELTMYVAVGPAFPLGYGEDGDQVVSKMEAYELAICHCRETASFATETYIADL